MRSKSFLHRAFGALVAIAVFAAPAGPAEANYVFTPANIDALVGLLPDTCYPVWGGTWCLTFTDAAYLTQLATAQNGVQMGQMLSQGLQDGKLGDLAWDFGVDDPTGVQNASAVAAAALSSPAQPLQAAAQVYQQQQAKRAAEMGGLYNAVQANGIGEVSVAQLQTVALLKLWSEQAQQNQLTAAAAQQSAIETQTSVDQAADLLDLHGGGSAAAALDL